MSSPALLLIDVQENMFAPAGPVASADLLLSRFQILLTGARRAKSPIIFVRNCGVPGDPDERGTPGWQLHPSLQPAMVDLVLDKTSSDTFETTSLHDELQARSVSHLIVAGLQSEYCVSKTILGALARGYEITLVTDGHSTYDTEDHSARQITEAVNEQFQGRVHLATAETIRFS